MVVAAGRGVEHLHAAEAADAAHHGVDDALGEGAGEDGVDGAAAGLEHAGAGFDGFGLRGDEHGAGAGESACGAGHGREFFLGSLALLRCCGCFGLGEGVKANRQGAKTPSFVGVAGDGILF